MLQVQSSSVHRGVVLSHPVVPLSLRVGELLWQEACLLGRPTWQRRRRSKWRLTQLFFLFLQSCVPEVLAHSPSTRMHLYALKGLYSFAELKLHHMHVLPFLSCFAAFRPRLFSQR